jgi:mono/diheme cytochrome c family protein
MAPIIQQIEPVMRKTSRSWRRLRSAVAPAALPLVALLALSLPFGAILGNASQFSLGTRATNGREILADGAESTRSHGSDPVLGLAKNPARVPVTPEAQSKADNIYNSRCATCHGQDGRGDGPAASNLNPKPMNFHDVKWQKSISNDLITKAIVHGGKSVGVSGQMAANPDLENEPAILEALVDRIRAWGK